MNYLEDSDQWCAQNKELVSTQIIVPKVPQFLGKEHCSKLNGKLPVPMPELRAEYGSTILDVVGENVCGSGSSVEFWLGLEWSVEEDAYLDINTRQKLGT